MSKKFNIFYLIIDTHDFKRFSCATQKNKYKCNHVNKLSFIFYFFFVHQFKFSVQFISVAQSCLTLCYPMNRSTPGLPVHHKLLEFTEAHVHRVGDASSHFNLCCPLHLLPQSLRASGSFPMSQLFT